MCEYCGCQSLRSIEQLTAEHDAVRALLRDASEAARTGDLARAQEVVPQVEAILEPHTIVEESGLFPAMARDFADHVARLEAEHVQVAAGFATVTSAEPAADWPDRLEAATRLLIEHIFREQDGLFPAALATLEPEDWDAVDKVRADLEAPLSSAARLPN
jgi:hemerythrin-like domain-containing protein